MDNQCGNEHEEQQIPFQDWLDGEVKALITMIQKRGNSPAQGAYILAVALGGVLQHNAKGSPTEDRLHMPLALIGHMVREQAVNEWNASQIIN